MLRKLIDLCVALQNKCLYAFALYPKLACLGLGVLLTFALPPFYQIWAIFPSLAIALYLCCQTSSLKKLIGLGYWFGFGFFSAGFYWIGNALLIDVAQTGWMYPIALFFNGSFFGIFTILPFMITKFCKNVWAKVLLFCAFWVLSGEWFRGVFLTGFPWNPLSSVLAFSPALLQTLAWWGTYGLSLVVVLLGVLPVFWLIKPNHKTFCLPVLSVFILFVIWNYGGFVIAHRPKISNGKSIMVRLVQPSIPQTLKWDRDSAEKNLDEYIKLSKTDDNRYVDFVIWGETASPYDFTYDDKHRLKIKRAIPRKGYLISGFLRYGESEHGYKPYNSLGVFDDKGNVVATYDKSHLVPFGEYIPLREYLPEWIKPVANNVAELGRGEKYKTISVEGYPAFAPLICYEIIFSDEVVRKFNKPKWMVVLTNDGWYGLSAGPHQHLVAAQMRAIEEGISVVRSANSGISAVITPYGQIKAKLSLGQKGSVDILVKPDLARDTLFGRYGNIIPLSMCGALIALALLIELITRKISQG